MQPTLDVKFFANDLGTEPVRDWLRTLPSIDRKTIGEDIKTVQIGWPLGMPLVRNLGGGMWEVRIKLENRIARVLFVLDGALWCCYMASSRSSKIRLSRTWIWRRIVTKY